LCDVFRSTSYIDQMSAWYDAKTKQEIVSIKLFEKLEVDVALCSSCWKCCLYKLYNSLNHIFSALHDGVIQNRKMAFFESQCSFTVIRNQATVYVSQHIWCMSQARINWEGCGMKGSGIRRMAQLISPDGVASSWIVNASASVLFPCTIKPRMNDECFFWYWLTQVVLDKGS